MRSGLDEATRGRSRPLAAAIARLAAERYRPESRGGDPALTVGREWRTASNRLVEVRVECGGLQETIFLKRNEREEMRDHLATEWRRTVSFRRYFDRVRPAMDSVEPIAYYPDLDVMAVRGCGPTSLTKIVRSSCGWLAPWSGLRSAARMSAAVGEWLAHLEKSSAGTVAPRDARELLLQWVARGTRQIQEARFLSPFASVVIACRKRIEAIPEQSPVPAYTAHGDFHTDNLFVSETPSMRVTAIDLSFAGPRFRGYDALFFERQMLMSMPGERFDPRKVRRLLNAFREGYGGPLDRSCPVVRGLEAYLVLAGLVYLATRGRDASLARQSLCYLDARRQVSGSRSWKETA